MFIALGRPRGESLDHRLAQRIAQWADGNAHDALAALLSAADCAVAAEHEHIHEPDVTVGIDSVPCPCISLDRIFTLSSNQRSGLRVLVDLDAADRESVTAATEAIAAVESIDLSAGTVKRVLYYLAELGVGERIPRTNTSGKSRPPSRVKSKFPTRAFRRLYNPL